ncbi:hypothetical protein C2845_PM05G23670 [Panicum miliaceum]|uniref:MCAfunc domain-containing protein n=1 Tax=Panicum miliaceum TaxID=4540 RepID=A0A3L6T0Z0_PANMI|nr:hypothetical protein C2845_PM05G23670 [Panicum miliaceum]
MESLSSVGTIVRIAQDIAGAVATVSKNRSRCQKLAKRVQGIGDLLKELNSAEAGATTAGDDATSKLLGRLEEALRRALLLVQSCQESGCPRSLIAGGRMANRFEEVDGEIDRCLLDLGVANRILIARLERQLRRGVVRYRDPARTETVTLRIGMPCDDDTDGIKRSIGMLQGVTDVTGGASATSKDQFRVTVTSDSVDIPSLLDKVKEKLNRNVELITPGTTKNANNKSLPADASYHMDRQNYRRSAIGDETKKEKLAAIAAAAAPNMAAGSNQALLPYAYLPFAVALVPIGDATASSMYLTPSPYSYPPPYSQGTPAAGYAVQAQRPSNPQHVHFNSTERCDGASDAVKKSGDRDEKKGNVTADGGSADKEADPALTAGGGKRKDGGKTAAAAADNVTAAIGVPVHTVTAGVAGLVPVPPPSYGHGYLPYARGRDAGHGCCQNNAGGPSDGAAAAANYNHYSWYPDMFSDENPNACSVM